MHLPIRVIISGGGTGGHIFPAISIADAIRAIDPKADILFVGATGRMEMQRVPAAGYSIVGLPIRGFYRKHLWKNVGVVWKILKSQSKAKRILREFFPDVVVGVGGYASGPMLNKAASMGIPCLIQEQNSYAGVTNKLLAKKADLICVAYEGMERFFPKLKLMLSGNPVREQLLHTDLTPQQARESLGLDADKPTLLIVGGSLGARTLNDSVAKHLDMLRESGVQLLWQTGKCYFEELRQQFGEDNPLPDNVKMVDFISQMGEAYRAAELVISRAGACSISEFSLIGKPVILVPSPNVAEDHQTKNALALADRNAAIMIPDSEAREKLIETALTVIADKQRLHTLSDNILQMALPNSAYKIAREVFRLAEIPL